jgi:hypothetical protein
LEKKEMSETKWEWAIDARFVPEWGRFRYRRVKELGGGRTEVGLYVTPYMEAPKEGVWGIFHPEEGKAEEYMREHAEALGRSIS